MNRARAELAAIDREIHLEVAATRTTAAIATLSGRDLAAMPIEVARKVIALLSAAQILAAHAAPAKKVMN